MNNLFLAQIRKGAWLALLWVGLTAAAHGQIPAVSSFAPASGAPGTSVILTGLNFSGATKVRCSTVDAIFEVLSPTQIALTVPLDALTGPISVSRATGTGSSAASFVVAPRITDFSPPLGLAGATVIISGANFVSGATVVKFNGVTASATVTAQSQLSATVPAGATNGLITVTTAAGTATSGTAFAVSSAPIITDFSPTLAKYGTRVVINGVNFINAATTVKINGTNAAPVFYTGQGGTQIQVDVPTGATTGPITVTTANGTFTTSTNFVTGAGPIITDFTPVAGVAGTRVTINGLNFAGATSLTFSNNLAAAFDITSESQIQVTVPAGAVTGPIRITRAGLTGQSPIAFHAGPDPIITEFSPTNGLVNTDITLTGANLTTASIIRFNGVLASGISITGQGGSQAHIRVPAGATTGFITVSDGTTTNRTDTPFVVTGPGPYVSGFSPGSGPVGGEVIVAGENFVNVTGVSFNGISASGSVTASTQLKAIVPPGASSGPITVTTTSGSFTTTSLFFVWPRITGFSPAIGVAGTSVSVIGANFTNATAVQFNGVSANFTVHSTTNLTVTVPDDALTGTLSVSTPAGIVASTTNFFVPPTLASFDPVAGPVGTSVLLSGTALLGATSVKFNGKAAIFSVVSRRQIVAVVPAQASSGPITITTADGTATSGNDFTILPTVAGFSPASGAVGASVVVTGSSFAGVTQVYFNGVAADFNLNAPGQLTAIVPVLATPGRITLATAEGYSSSAQDFQVLPVIYLGVLPGQEILIGWPTWATNFVLEATTNLSPVASWSLITNSPTPLGGENLITNSSGSGQRFYRLRSK